MGLSLIKTAKKVINNDRVINRPSYYDLDGFHVNKKLLYFKAIKDYFPSAISYDYYKMLPTDFIETLFDNKETWNTSKNPTINQAKIEKRLYHEKIQDLKFICEQIIRKYTSQDVEWEQFNTVDKLGISVSESDINRDKECYAVQEYAQTKTDCQRLQLKNLKNKTLIDVETIIHLLYELEEHAQYIDRNNDSYLKFTNEIACTMYGNAENKYPRSVINYTAFKFCNKKYPSDKNSSTVHDVANITPDLKNVMKVLELNIKNIDAICAFLRNIEFVENDDVVTAEVEILKNSYGLCIALVALYGELSFNETIGKDALLTGTKREQGSLLDDKNKKINERNWHLPSLRM